MLWRATVVAGLALAVGFTDAHRSPAPVAWQAPHDARAPIRLAPEVLASLQDGDLVFRRSPDMTSWVIRAQSQQARFTHVGMIVRDGDRLFVLHALPAEAAHDNDGVRLQPLTDFYRAGHAEEIALYRPRDLSAAGRSAARRFALAQRGKPFDSRFVYSEDRSMYCTEVVMKALARAGVRADLAVPRVKVLLHDEGITTPDDLRRWNGLVPLAERSIAL